MPQKHIQDLATITLILQYITLDKKELQMEDWLIDWLQVFQSRVIQNISDVHTPMNHPR